MLISREADSLEHLPRGSAVLCGSPRRRAQVLARRGDLEVLPVRGNIHTRLAKFDASTAAGMILARAGLVRLGLARAVSAAAWTRRLSSRARPGRPGRAVPRGRRRRARRRRPPSTTPAPTPPPPASGRCWPAWAAGAACPSAPTRASSARADPPGRHRPGRRTGRLAADQRTRMQAPCPDLAAAQALGRKLADHLRAAGADETSCGSLPCRRRRRTPP